MVTCSSRERSCLHLRAEWVLPLERKKKSFSSLSFLQQPFQNKTKLRKSLKKPSKKAKANSDSVSWRKGSLFGLDKTFVHTGLGPPCLSDLTTNELCTCASGSSPVGWNSVSTPGEDEFSFPFLAVLQFSGLSSLGLRGVF